MRISDWSSDVCSSDLQDLNQTDRIGRTAAQIERLTRHAGHSAHGRYISSGDVAHMHDVTHLPPITEQRDFLIPQCRAHKMGNPALLFRAHLMRSEEHTSELQSLMRISYAVFCLKKKKTTLIQTETT